MEIRQLQISDIHPDLLSHFNRYQEVLQCWKKTGDNRVLVDTSYIRDWDEEKKKRMTGYFSRNIEQGGIFIGAFDENNLIGIMQLGGKFYGSENQYVNLSLLIVSKDFRHQGLGRMLFSIACEKAIGLSAKKLYISAHSAKEVIAFYEKMGCKDAQENIPELLDEPNDWQLEYNLFS